MSNKQTKGDKERVSGVILIDKPQGMTSQQVVSKVKYLFKSPRHDSRKAGHTGTLDPMATGLLPICMGEATKFSHYQLNASKSYEAVIQLGIQTDTGDAEGQVIKQHALPDWQSIDLSAVTQQFLGEQQQVPPMYSALKKDGKKLYEYARAGIEIERSSRPIIIEQLELDQLSSDCVGIKVTCSKGTYVRVLGEDIAKALGSVGHLISLRRTAVGDFELDKAIDLSQLEDMDIIKRFAYLLPLDACINDLPIIQLSETQCERLRLGQRLNVSTQIDAILRNYLQMQTKEQQSDESSQKMDDQSHSYDVRLINEEQEFVGLGSLSEQGRLQPKKMIHF